MKSSPLGLSTSTLKTETPVSLETAIQHLTQPHRDPPLSITANTTSCQYSTRPLPELRLHTSLADTPRHHRIVSISACLKQPRVVALVVEQRCGLEVWGLFKLGQDVRFLGMISLQSLIGVDVLTIILVGAAAAAYVHFVE